MGSAASSNAESVETFKTLQSTYESAKDVDDVELFNMLSTAYDKRKLAESSKKEVNEKAPADESAPQVKKTATKEDNKSFLIACGAFHKGNAKADLVKAKNIFNNGVDVDFVDGDGWSALFHACGEGHISVVEWLTEECNANVELKDPEGCTPLWVAAFNNRRNVVQHLLHIGADDTIKAEPEGEPVQTPSSAARRNKHPGVADFIDDETALRVADPARRGKQVAREMTMDEFRESLRRKGGNQS